MIGAATDNGTGVAGGTWSGRILPVRVLGKCGGYDSDIVAGMRWAAGLPVDGAPPNPNPARILNLSLGSADRCASVYSNAIAELAEAGVLVIASAGNDSGPVEAPANCPGVLAVGGLRHVGTKVGYSSLGAEVGISAPAGNCPDIDSTFLCSFSLVTATTRDRQCPPRPATRTTPTTTSAPASRRRSCRPLAGLMYGVNDGLTTGGVHRPHQVRRPPLPGARAGPADLPEPRQLQRPSATARPPPAVPASPMHRAQLREALRPMARIVKPDGTGAGQNVTLDGSAQRGSPQPDDQQLFLDGRQWRAAAFVGATDGADGDGGSPGLRAGHGAAGGHATTLGRTDAQDVTLGSVPAAAAVAVVPSTRSCWLASACWLDAAADSAQR